MSAEIQTTLSLTMSVFPNTLSFYWQFSVPYDHDDHYETVNLAI
jgi:hypothetical protein